jgi:hypothetical protein
VLVVVAAVAAARRVLVVVGRCRRLVAGCGRQPYADSGAVTAGAPR